MMLSNVSTAVSERYRVFRDEIREMDLMPSEVIGLVDRSRFSSGRRELKITLTSVSTFPLKSKDVRFTRGFRDSMKLF